MTTRIVTDSVFGNAGQRCLAASLDRHGRGGGPGLPPALAEAARTRVVGSGLEAGVQMGPVISAQSKRGSRG